MFDMKQRHLEVGRLGEDIACRFLKSKGYLVFERNFRKKQGEIDIIAKKDSKTYFFEVKTVSCENIEHDVSYETKDTYRPEDNIHPLKLKRLSETISLYLIERKMEDVEWTFGAVSIYLDREGKKAKIDLLEDLIL